MKTYYLPFVIFLVICQPSFTQSQPPSPSQTIEQTINRPTEKITQGHHQNSDTNKNTAQQSISILKNKEPDYIQDKSTKMSIDRLATLVSSVGTFFGALIILFTLLEIAKQRKSTYRPDLVFGRNEFYIYGNDSTKTTDIWSPIKLTKADRGKNHNDQLPLRLFNIGMGTAKNITAKWEFDIKECINKIKELDGEKKYTIELKESDYLEVSYSHRQIFFPRMTMMDSIDYILPAHVENEPYKLRIPYLYLVLTSIIFTLSFKKGLNSSFPSHHGLKVALNYLDIGNNEHKKEFLIETQPFSFSQSADAESPDIWGSVEFKEVK
jgi:hypothetical protein